MKNPFLLLAANVQVKIKSALYSIQAKFKSESDNLRNELGTKAIEIRQVSDSLSVAKGDIASLREENCDINSKFAELKKAWNVLQSTSASVAKVQKLIEAYKRIKNELLDLRRQCDCSANGFDCLQQENNKLKILMGNISDDGKVDVVSLLETVSSLKKENSLYRTRCENLERLVKNIKKSEEKLANAIRARNVL
ncbi:hypothetical protein GTA51_02770 [Desulfovibrio aerotolerans]|uniref:Uncharacterized protein n=1 Tax=Solidesulfovibrio aerotolerans TaxID=295255 RepID=A0A7C9IUW0_9BACT|nr:hypothetical protein [Solidesulfovibrio aerotolerans]MYL82062.1 hypothetical protein [Solidesulfovibrio aerotolerans]